MNANKPTKCWFCAKLGKCQVLKPCKDFSRYYYNLEEVASACGVSYRCLARWLKNDSKYALATIKTRTGLDLEYVETESGKHKLVKKEDADT